MKKIFIPFIFTFLGIIGGADLVDANLAIFDLKDQENSRIEYHDTHQTREGLIELSLASIIALLNQFLSSNKGPLQSNLQLFEQRTAFTISKYGKSDQSITNWLNNHKADMMLIIEHELGKELARAITINDFSFQVDQNCLNYKTTLKILQFTEPSRLQLLERYIKEIIKMLVEHKLHHLAETLVNNSEKYSNDNSELLKESINECFKVQVLQVNKNEEILVPKPKLTKRYVPRLNRYK